MKKKNYPALVSTTVPADPETLELYQYAALADATNTQRAYASDWKQFLTWCKKRGKNPLPAHADDVAIYIRHCAEIQKLKISTVKRRLSSIAEAHKRNGFESPCGEWVVKNTMKRLRRELGKPARGKSPLLVKDLKAMLTHCPPTLFGLRDKAVLLIGYTGAFRRSELVRIEIEDITASDEGIVVLVRASKTDQKRDGRKVAIPFGKDPSTCPVRALLTWLDAANISEGPVFRGMTKVGTPRTTALSDRMVAEIVKTYCSKIKKRVALFSGHSLRSGLATSAAIAGASERSIQQQTGHKSIMVLRRYIRDASLFRENAATKLNL